MALFNWNKQEETETTSKLDVVSSTPELHSAHSDADLSHILKNPRITEKATMHSEQSVYLFDISSRATKRSVSQAVSALYKVTPRMIRIVQIPMKVKRNMRTGKRGIKRGGKKAYVYLKRGENITIA